VKEKGENLDEVLGISFDDGFHVNVDIFASNNWALVDKRSFLGDALIDGIFPTARDLAVIVRVEEEKWC
jgi:hypothetical protein